MLSDLKPALRSALSTPGPVLVVIVTLALAIGANTAIFSVVNGVLLRPLGYADEDGLVVVWSTNPSQGLDESQMSTGDYRDYREMTATLDGQLAAYRYRGFTMTALERPDRVGSVRVSPRLFSILGIDPLLGRVFDQDDEKAGSEHQIILTHAGWTRRFGADEAILGATIELDSEPYVVVGVMPPGFVFPPGDSNVEMYSPITLDDRAMLDRPHRMYNTVGRIGPDRSRAEVANELTAVAERLDEEFPDANEGWRIRVEPLYEEVVGDMGSTLWVLFGAVTLVLLIACANVANLLVARASRTSREFAVRAALGAGRTALMRRSLVESTLLGVTGGVAGVVLALWGVAWLRNVIPTAVPRGSEVTIDVAVLVFAALLSISASLIFGLAPALRSMTPDLSDLLKSRGATTSPRAGRLIRDGMVVAEVALAIVLLIGAGLMVRSFARLSEVDPGFRESEVVAVAIQLPPSRYGTFGSGKVFFEGLVDKLREAPGITNVGAVSDLPISEVGVAFEMPFSVLGLEAQSPTERPSADFRAVIAGYMEAMAIPLIKGRYFDRFDGQEGREVTIINDALARRYFPDIDPIGQTLQMPMAGELQIVGVVGDTRHGGLQSEVAPELYVPYDQMTLSEMHIVVQSSLPAAAVARNVREFMRELDDAVAPTAVVRMEDLLWESVAQPRFNTALMVGLAFCAAVLAVVGVYGVVSYSVAQRTGEIGVRMALGASSGNTVAMVVRQALLVVGAGSLLGVMGALGAARFLERMLFEVRATDPWTYLVVLAAALSVGAFAAWVPARRATRVDPVAALRDD